MFLLLARASTCIYVLRCVLSSSVCVSVHISLSFNPFVRYLVLIKISYLLTSILALAKITEHAKDGKHGNGKCNCNDMLQMQLELYTANTDVRE